MIIRHRFLVRFVAACLLGGLLSACSSSEKEPESEPEASGGATSSSSGGKTASGGQGGTTDEASTGGKPEVESNGGQGGTPPEPGIDCEDYCEATEECFCYNQDEPCNDDCMSECTFSAASEQGCPEQFLAYMECTVEISNVCRTGYFYDAVEEDCTQSILDFVECDRSWKLK